MGMGTSIIGVMLFAPSLESYNKMYVKEVNCLKQIFFLSFLIIMAQEAIRSCLSAVNSVSLTNLLNEVVYHTLSQ